MAKKNTAISSPEDLKGKKIGVVKASTFKNLVAKYTDQITEYDSDITALMDLEPGRVDAVITDQMVGLRMIKEGKSKIKEAGKPLNLDEMGIAIRKDDKEMVEKVNKALDEIIKDGTYEKISKNGSGVIFSVKRKKRSKLAIQRFINNAPLIKCSFYVGHFVSTKIYTI